MSEKIIIASDSTTDLSPEIIERYNIKTVPINVILGDKTLRDGIDIDADAVYEHHAKTGELPKTAALNIAEYGDFFSELTKDGDSVIFFSLGSGFSSTLNNARIAAEDFENVYVIDTMNLSTGSGLLALYAGDLREKGLPAKEIAEKVTALIPNVDASFVIDSLEYLYKGGRCSALSMLGANLLKLKPCIEVKNGLMEVGKKYRGKYSDVLKEYVKERLNNIDDISKDRVFITHAGCDEQLMKELIEIVKSYNYFDEILFTRAGCTISSHCGRNTMGILFIRKSPIA